jgi:hypothetical protein
MMMIRVILGFLMVFGSVGGMDNASDAQLFPLTLIALGGMMIMAAGVNKITMRG